MIYTSYYGNLRNIPNNIIRINIANIIPYNFNGPSLPALFPPWWLVERYKANGDWASYVDIYTEKVLSVFNPNEIYNDILKMTNGADAVLLCYERPESNCHRHLVREWFNKNNIKCEEWRIHK